jgi:carboxymethylenebutenolidase
MPAYLARPTSPGSYPAVVLGFEMFGVTGYVRSVVDRIARLGYTAVAPDFYHRLGHRIELTATPQGRSRGLELLQGLTREGVRQDVHATLDYLDQDEDHRSAAMVGLSVGGHLAYYAATQIPLSAVAVFYPGWLTGTDIPLSRPEPTLTLTAHLAEHGTRLLFLAGGQDHLISAEQRAEIGDRLRECGVRHEMVTYPDAPHGFFCHERDTYHPAAAEDAWRRLAALLRQPHRP